ncbi:P-loop containing nucleoside triphosphate hydrolase protein [Ascobolus immersus RN42]|uniref:P-loop containing nucleoside triphosphate hydrolase protein n=1 Tax=Ascobolus immersus RN42 TaxID=1160509 RepID=A0A3N4IK77_ASCIM|nr:P-loop containing nucleoside triphosphate hydrolase protein [Ascobolus immersus RN42]
MALRASTSAALIATRPFLTKTILPLCCTAVLRQTRKNATLINPSDSADKVPRPNLSSEVPGELDLQEPLSQPLGPALRPYQEECIQAVMNYLGQGDRRLGVSLATGSGKTVIFTNIISRIPPPSPERTQTLILVHRKELAEQAYTTVKSTHSELKVELEMGATHQATGMADVTIAMVQSLVASDGKRLEKFNPDTHKLVLMDECHHAVSKSWLRVLQHMKIWDDNGPITLGFSATMHRADGMGLGKVLQRIVFHKDFMDMAKEKWLADAIFTTVRTMVDLTYVPVERSGTGDFNIAKLSQVMNTPSSNDLVVKAWHTKCLGRKSTLVFCVDVSHVVNLTHVFRNQGIDARAVTGKTPIAERTALVKAFKNGEFPVLVNCGLFTEGTDIPNIDCIVLARPTRSKALLIQMIGRGMRLHSDKSNCHVLDIACSIKNGVLTAPTLFGLDPDLLCDHTPGSTLYKQSTEIDLNPPPPPQVPGETDPLAMEFTDYDNIMDLLEDVKPDQHVRSISQFAWVACSQHKWILQCGGHGFIRIERDLETNTFSGHAVRGMLFIEHDLSYARRQFRNLMRPLEIFSDIELFEHAIHAADTYAASHFPRQLILTSAHWRSCSPSQTQLEMLSRILNQHIHKGNCGGWTKGKVADMITKMKYGAKSQWEKAQKEMWRRDQARERQQQLEQAATIRVGELLDVAEKIEHRRAVQQRSDEWAQTPVPSSLGELLRRKGREAMKPWIGARQEGEGPRSIPSERESEAIVKGRLGKIAEPKRLVLDPGEFGGEEVSVEEEVRRDLEREAELERALARKLGAVAGRFGRKGLVQRE